MKIGNYSYVIDKNTVIRKTYSTDNRHSSFKIDIQNSGLDITIKDDVKQRNVSLRDYH